MTNNSNPDKHKTNSTRKSSHTKHKKQCVKTLLMSSMMLMLVLASTAPILINYHKKLKKKQRLSEIALERVARHRVSWSTERKFHTDKLFFRLFRMKPTTFNKLCVLIEKAVGKQTFKSEQYLNWLLDGPGSKTKQGVLYRNSKKYSGDYVSGEWKVAMTLRYLAGAKYLDLYL